MSVRKNERDTGELQVLRIATELAQHTFRKCNNENIFPKRVKFTLSDKMVNTSLAIMEYVSMANSTRLDTDAELRVKYQREAMTQTHRLESLVRFSYEMLASKSDMNVQHWISLIMEMRKSLRNWMKSDNCRTHKG